MLLLLIYENAPAFNIDNHKQEAIHFFNQLDNKIRNSDSSWVQNLRGVFNWLFSALFLLLSLI